ncbi:hypothetical protein [Paracoccus liaowanqingii]|nr:hypothetical protein [Paracoccus liaowanqingii]
MFDIQTEAFLRRSKSRDETAGTGALVPAAIGASLILWVTVLLLAS